MGNLILTILLSTAIEVLSGGESVLNLKDQTPQEFNINIQPNPDRTIHFVEGAMTQPIKATKPSNSNKQISIGDIRYFLNKKQSQSIFFHDKIYKLKFINPKFLRKERKQSIDTEPKYYDINSRIVEPINKINNFQQQNIDYQRDKFYCGRTLVYGSAPVSPIPADKGEKFVRTKYGFNIFVDQNDGLVSKVIEESGTWQPQYIKLIGHIVKPGNNILNLGSQVGLQAILMGKIIGSTGKLFIFEPYQISNKIVNKNVELNGCKNYTKVYKLGASDQKGKATLTIRSENTGGSFILPSQMIPNQQMQRKTVQQVELDTVDSVLAPDTSIDFALIDVEQMEIPALRGMRETIKRSPNLIMMVEWQYRMNPMANEQQTLEFLNFMIERGYKMFQYQKRPDTDCQLGRLLEYTRKQDLLEIQYNDVFFIPQHHEFLKPRQ